jgi:hypothetical protein
MGRLTKCPVAAEPSWCVAGSSPQFPSEESRAQIRLFNHRVRGSDHAQVTMETPSIQRPKALVVEITTAGVGLKLAPPTAIGIATSTPARAG